MPLFDGIKRKLSRSLVNVSNKQNSSSGKERQKVAEMPSLSSSSSTLQKASSSGQRKSPSTTPRRSVSVSALNRRQFQASLTKADSGINSEDEMTAPLAIFAETDIVPFNSTENLLAAGSSKKILSIENVSKAQLLLPLRNSASEESEESSSISNWSGGSTSGESSHKISLEPLRFRPTTDNYRYQQTFSTDWNRETLKFESKCEEIGEGLDQNGESLLNSVEISCCYDETMQCRSTLIFNHDQQNGDVIYGGSTYSEYIQVPACHDEHEVNIIFIGFLIQPGRSKGVSGPEP